MVKLADAVEAWRPGEVVTPPDLRVRLANRRRSAKTSAGTVAPPRAARSGQLDRPGVGQYRLPTETARRWVADPKRPADRPPELQHKEELGHDADAALAGAAEQAAV